MFIKQIKKLKQKKASILGQYIFYSQLYFKVKVIKLYKIYTIKIEMLIAKSLRNELHLVKVRWVVVETVMSTKIQR